MEQFIAEQSDFLKRDKSQLEFCNLAKCDIPNHKMRVVYLSCECVSYCTYMVKMKYCQVSGFSELYCLTSSGKCISKKVEEIPVNAPVNIHEYIALTRQPTKKRRGVPVFIKEELKVMMKIDPDLNPKRARKNLINQNKEKVEARESTYDASYIPELNKVTLFNWLNCNIVKLFNWLNCLIYNRSLHGCADSRNQQ